MIEERGETAALVKKIDHPKPQGLVSFACGAEQAQFSALLVELGDSAGKRRQG